MARKRGSGKPSGRKYRIGNGGVFVEVEKWEFVKAIHDGLIWQSETDARSGQIRSPYRVWVDRQVGVARFELAEEPRFDASGVPSWWPALVYRHGFYYGQANSLLWSYARQTEGI